ncbi:hypothetical protein SESBI_34282 [Sesbania bispinosa]|nr:hypothetical protein SESBI_34282 [Sesbania bispinosa]
MEHKVATASEGQPIRCKAAVARRAGEPLVMEEIIVAPPMPREDPPGFFPRILGHEAVGVVESVGKDVTEVTKGDVVIPIFLPDCGECVDCKSTKSNRCTNFPFKVSPWMPRYGGTTRFTDLNGEIIYHFMFVSSFSEYTVVDIANVTKIDPEIPPDRACLLSCGVSTGVGAAWRTADVEPGSTVAIFGLGSVGLAVAEGARLCGATRIIGVDVNPEKFEIGKKFGLTDFVHAGDCGNKPISQVIIEITGGGADYCFECVGMASLVHEAYASCRKGWGKTIVLGVDKPGARLSLSSSEVLHNGKTLMGSVFGGLKPKSHVPILLKRYMDKELQLDEFVTHEVEFKNINKAFDLLSQGQCLRCYSAALQMHLKNQQRRSSFCSSLTCCFTMEHKQVAATTEGQPIRCKAAVARRAGEPLVIEEIIVAPPMPREIRIRIICTSLCHVDITFWKMQDPPGFFPRILGHESIGIVESVGKDVTEITKGDVVIPIFLPDCGECVDCKSTRSNLCSNFPFEASPWLPRHGTTRFTDLNGESIYHFMFVSSFSEYTVVDIANVTKIDLEIPPNRACLLTCGIAAGIGAAWRTASVEPGSSVAIFGLGSIGLAVAEGARLCGATRIIGVDVNPEKFEIGKKFGVTDFVHAGECGNKPVSQVIIEITGGGADYCFECVGMASMVHEAYASCRKGWGKTIVLGKDKPGSSLSLSSSEVLHDGKTLKGTLFGGLKPKSHVSSLLKRYMDKHPL